MKRRGGERDPVVTSRIMSCIRGKDTVAEVLLRSALFARGLRFRKHVAGLPGKPDIVFPGVKLCVFVDGDFWHGREWRRRGYKCLRDAFRRNKAFWEHKIGSTIERDKRNSLALRKAGWNVIRVWESDVQKHVDRVADRVANRIEHLRGRGRGVG